MAKRRGCGTWLLGAVVVSSVGVIACCGCSGLLVVLAPNLLVSLFTWMVLEDAPLGPRPVPVDAGTRERVVAQACGDLWAGRPTSVDPALLTGILAYDASPELAHLAIVPTADGWSITMSFLPEGGTRYVNLSGAGAFTMERGWFTDARIDAAALSSWTFDDYVKGQQLATNLNQSLANQRAENPELAAILDSFERISTAGGQLELVPGPGAAEKLAFCSAYRATDPPPGLELPGAAATP